MENISIFNFLKNKYTVDDLTDTFITTIFIFIVINYLNLLYIYSRFYYYTLGQRICSHL